jgi:hypothetical protein
VQRLQTGEGVGLIRRIGPRPVHAVAKPLRAS